MTRFGLQLRLPTIFLSSSPSLYLSLPFLSFPFVCVFGALENFRTGSFCLQVEAARAARGLLSSKAFESKLALSVQFEALLVPDDLRSSP